MFIEQLVASQRVGDWLDVLRSKASLAQKQRALVQLAEAVQNGGHTYFLEVD